MVWSRPLQSSPINTNRYNHFTEILRILIILWSSGSLGKCPSFIQVHLDYNLMSCQKFHKHPKPLRCHIFVPHLPPHLKQNNQTCGFFFHGKDNVRWEMLAWWTWDLAIYSPKGSFTCPPGGALKVLSIALQQCLSYREHRIHGVYHGVLFLCVYACWSVYPDVPWTYPSRTLKGNPKKKTIQRTLDLMFKV